MKSENLHKRYQRQMLLKEFGLQGQQKLLEAKVLVLGAGGLGCPILQYLTAAGIGTIGIVDDDVVSLHNLHRQVLFNVDDIGLSKAQVAKEKLQRVNPEITIKAYPERLTVANALQLFASFSIVIDGTDNFATRYLINDACVLLNKPLIYGAVSGYEGQVAIFNIKSDDKDAAVNYRDLFPQPPKDGEVLNCEETGVLGVLPGIIGTMMANETIKYIAGIGNMRTNQLLTFNALTNQHYELMLSPNKQTRSLIPESAEAFQRMNYETLCASSASLNFEIDASIFEAMLDHDDIEIIDVRESSEQPRINEFAVKQFPLSELKENLASIKGETIVAFCQTGKRSLQAAHILQSAFGETKKIWSLQGGIISWKKWHDETLR